MAASGAAQEGPGYLLLETHDVALGNEGEKDYNKIVLTGVDIVIPVELDMDGDPFQDDAVRLRAEHGYFDQVLVASDSDVEADTDSRYLFYRFRHVPPGAYRVSVRIGDDWVPLLRGLVVTKDGAFVGGKKLGEERPESKPAEPEEDAGDGELPGTPRTECVR